MGFSSGAKVSLAAANTWSGDQTLASGKSLIFGTSARLSTYGGGDAGDELLMCRNAKWDGAALVRTVADNEAGVLILRNDGALSFSQSTDAGNTVGSVITFAERFRITGAGALAFFGVAGSARTAAYNQAAYATASRVGKAKVDETAAALASYGYTQTQANDITATIAKLQTMVNQIIDDLQAYGIFQ